MLSGSEREETLRPRGQSPVLSDLTPATQTRSRTLGGGALASSLLPVLFPV